VLAVLDTDRLHDRIPTIVPRRTIDPAGYAAWAEAAERAVRDSVAVAGQAPLESCLLDHNLETLLAIVGRGAEVLNDALSKDRLARDKLLARAASDAPTIARACAEMPSWGQLVETVARLC
jgi:hypothetical protein